MYKTLYDERVTPRWLSILLRVLAVIGRLMVRLVKVAAITVAAMVVLVFAFQVRTWRGFARTI